MPLRILEKVLHQGLFEKIERQVAHLRETDPSAKLNSIKIDGITTSSKLLRCDRVKVEKLFNGVGEGQGKRCDYLLLSNGIAYFIELKSNEKAFEVHKDDCIEKFNAVECITEYVDSVLVRFYKSDKIFENYQRRYILFYRATSINKTTTSLKPTTKPLNDSPEKMKPVAVENDSIINITLLG